MTIIINVLSPTLSISQFTQQRGRRKKRKKGRVTNRNWQNPQVCPFSGCCTADSQANMNQNQLNNNLKFAKQELRQSLVTNAACLSSYLRGSFVFLSWSRLRGLLAWHVCAIAAAGLRSITRQLSYIISYLWVWKSMHRKGWDIMSIRGVDNRCLGGWVTGDRDLKRVQNTSCIQLIEYYSIYDRS